MDERAALGTPGASVERAVNFFDPADVYGLGRSESTIGKFPESRAEEIVVATKPGRLPEPGWPENFPPKSLPRTRTDGRAALRCRDAGAKNFRQAHTLSVAR
jgi:aryl-alcohol dehydrogenase-like predicted oxidoreductase